MSENKKHIHSYSALEIKREDLMFEGKPHGYACTFVLFCFICGETKPVTP